MRSTGSALSSSGAKEARICLGLFGQGLVGLRLASEGGLWIVESAAVEPLRREGVFVESSFLKEAAARLSLKLGVVSADTYVSVEDGLVRTSIIDFDTLPFDKAEAAGVIGWKAAKEAYLSPADCRVGFHVLGSDKTPRVLASVMKKNDAEAIEEALKGSGFQVKRMSAASICAVNAIAGRKGGEKTSAVVSMIGGYLAVMMFSSGTIDFYRCKAVSSGQAMKELAATFAFYAGRNPDRKIERVYAAAGGAEGAAVCKEAGGAAGAPSEPVGIDTAGMRMRGVLTVCSEAEVVCAAGAAF